MSFLSLITPILLILAAIANACMDRVETPIHFDASVFYKKDKSFYSKVDSAKRPFIFGKYRLDFWHLCKSAMIVFLIAAIVLYKPLFHPAIDFAVMGLVWNKTFSLFYHKILLQKTWNKKT